MFANYRFIDYMIANNRLHVSEYMHICNVSALRFATPTAKYVKSIMIALSACSRAWFVFFNIIISVSALCIYKMVLASLRFICKPYCQRIYAIKIIYTSAIDDAKQFD
jgi:hypothetical protein